MLGIGIGPLNSNFMFITPFGISSIDTTELKDY